jgi:type I restriction enzyme S subunit
MKNHIEPWTDLIPKEWAFGRISYKYQVQLGKMLQPEPKTLQDIRKPYLRSANLDWNGVKLDDVKEMWFSPNDLTKYRLANGDVLVSEGGDVGRASFWDSPVEMYIQNAVNRLRPLTDESNPKFLFYWFSFLKSKGLIDIMCDSSTIAHYTAEKVKATKLVFPPYEEQTLIARFLDQKTGQIDRLIEQKEKLLKLLAEKRTAIITQAVTKGLDPDVEMIDSGIDWLGEIPKDWKVKKIKFLTNKVKTGTTPSSVGPDYYTDGTVDWYNPSDFNYESIELVESKRKIQESFFEDSKLTKYPKASVLIVGIGATLGKVGVSYSESYSNQQINAIYPTEKFSSEYLAYVLSSLVEVLKVYSNSTTLGIMNQEKTKNFSVPCPVVEVQDQIVFRIKELDKSLDTLIRKTIKSLVQLKEYRESLITAAVTGQIDVRKEITDE